MRFLTQLNLISHPIVLSVTISCLSASIILWQIKKKMTPQDIDTSGEASIIRALIITRGPNGATLEQLRGELSFNLR